jgi:hypothetical protein
VLLLRFLVAPAACLQPLLLHQHYPRTSSAGETMSLGVLMMVVCLRRRVP